MAEHQAGEDPSRVLPEVEQGLLLVPLLQGYAVDGLGGAVGDDDVVARREGLDARLVLISQSVQWTRCIMISFDVV